MLFLSLKLLATPEFTACNAREALIAVADCSVVISLSLTLVK